MWVAEGQGESAGVLFWGLTVVRKDLAWGLYGRKKKLDTIN